MNRPLSKTFRVFVSSTFTDLKAERNALQERVFPKLKDLCMQRGHRFRVGGRSRAGWGQVLFLDFNHGKRLSWRDH